MNEEEKIIPEICKSCLDRKLDGCDSVRLVNCLSIPKDKKAPDFLKFNKKHDPG